MKKFFLLFLIICLMSVRSVFSLPNFWFSGTAYNNLGQIIAGGSVEVDVNVTDGTHTYFEQFLSSGKGPLSTDAFGIVNVNIGTGTPISGNLSGVNMLASTKITVRVRPVGSSVWVIIAGQPLSVAYLNNYLTPGNIDITNLELQQGYILIGNNLNKAQPRVITGDATIDWQGNLLISNNAVTNSKLADNSVSTSKIADKSITTAKITNGAGGEVMVTDDAGNNVKWGKIINNNVADNAAIDGTKINPNFGSQNVSTTGNVTTGGTTTTDNLNVKKLVTMSIFKAATASDVRNSVYSMISFQAKGEYDAQLLFPSGVQEGTLLYLINGTQAASPGVISLFNLIGEKTTIQIHIGQSVTFIYLNNGTGDTGWRLLN